MAETRPIVGDDLTPYERELMEKLLSNPRIWPDTAKTWIADYVSQNSYLPASQLQGLRGVSRYFDRVQDDLSFTDTSQTVIYTKRIPGKSIAPGDRLEFEVLYTAMCTDVANSITLRWWLGGVNIGTVTIDAADLDASNRAGRFLMSMTNLGSYSEQLHYFNHTYAGGSGTAQFFNTVGTQTIDLSVDQTLELTARWTSAGTQNLVRKFVGVTIYSPIPEKA